MNQTRILKKEQRSPSPSRTRTRSIYWPSEERRQTPRRSQIQGLSRFRGHEGQNGNCKYFSMFFSSNFSLGRRKTSKRNQRQLSIPIEGWWRWSFWWVLGRPEKRIWLDQILWGWQGQGWLSNCRQGQFLCYVFKSICFIKDQDFVDMMSGKLDPQKAFMGGQIKVKGNMGLAMKLQKLK